MVIIFPSNAALFPYTNSYDAYVFGGLLAIIGIYIFLKMEKINPISILLFLLSLATYQVYIGLYLAIMIVYYFWKLVKEKIDSEIFFRNIFKVFVTIGLSILLYIIGTKYLLGIELTDYQGINEMGKVGFMDLIFGAVNAYGNFFSFFIFDKYYQFGFLKYFNILMLIAVFCLLYRMIIKLDIREK